MTIRRDLEKLEQNEEVKRVHGGAVIAERRAFEFDFKGKRQREKDAKTAIAKEAAKLVKEGQRLILDNGTTTLQLAVELKAFKQLTIITTSLAVASELQFSGLEVILTGGILREGSPHLTGMLTEHTLDILRADILFQGADAIDARGGLFNEDMMMSQVDQKMREQADCTCVMADFTKIGKTALTRTGSLNEVDYLITDCRLPQALHRKFSKLRAKIIKAKIT
jgi:DeoR/GlpR family transcriptional regulator of sugar metabolism